MKRWFLVLSVVAGCGSGNPLDPTACFDHSECQGPNDMTTCEALGLGGGATPVECVTCEWEDSVCSGAQGGEITVKVTRGGAPASGIAVAIGTSALVTDAQGEARADVDSAVDVSVADVKTNGNVDLRSYLGVPGGSTVPFDLAVTASAPTSTGTMRVTWENVPDGATTVKLANGCTSSTSSASAVNPVDLVTYTSCNTAPGVATLLAEASDPQGNPLGYKYFSNIEITAALPTVVLVDSWDTTFAAMPLTLTSTPSSGEDAVFTWRYGAGPFINQALAAMLVSSAQAGTEYTKSRSIPTDSFLVYASGTVQLGESRGATRFQTTPGPFTFDGGRITPNITSCAVDRTDVDRPGLAYEIEAAAANVDAMIAYLYFQTAQAYMTWTVYAVGTQSSPIRVPQLPADASWDMFRPTLWEQVLSSTRMALLDVDTIDGYQALYGGANLLAVPRTVYSTTAFPPPF